MLTMPKESDHIPEQDLLLAADGELSPRRMKKVRQHLAACWACRARMDEIETSILEFVRIHQRSLNSQVAPPNAPRAVFQAKLAEAARTDPPGVAERLFAFCFSRQVVVSFCVTLFLVLGFAAWRLQKNSVDLTPTTDYRMAGMTPNPALTPGATQPLGKEDLCSVTWEDRAPDVPRPVALRVFESYGIRDPRPRAFELDYLITPELGGTNDVRNLWPQPYHPRSWNAHAKDALEDRLFALVCDGKLDLTTAQRDIGADWIAAYKKYFQTDEPLPIHAAFLKDRPWE